MATVHLHRTGGASLSGEWGSHGSPAGKHSLPEVTSGEGRGPRGPATGDCPQTVTLKATAHKAQLLAGLRSPRPSKATCPRVTSGGGFRHLHSWAMERPSALGEGQRNPPPVGTVTQTQLLEVEGTKMNHSYQTWRRQERERERAGLGHRAGWAGPQNTTPWEGGASYEPLGWGLGG